jgi:DNA-binding transcriptional regulator PaaX
MKANFTNKQQPATIIILKALLPYTRQNLQLTFNPSQFFDELEHSSGFSRRTLIQSFARAKKQKYIMANDKPELTLKGRQYVQPFVAQKLANGQLMVIFDIPEDFSEQRRHLRLLLHRLCFSQIQRSVWVSENDHVEVLTDTIRDLKLGDWVQMYESSRLA